MICWFPKALLSRFIMATGFMALTALLIEQTGGAEEAHCSFFIMISVLVVYCDWRPLTLACVLILTYHFACAMLQGRGMGFYFWNDDRGVWGHVAAHGAVTIIQTLALSYLATILRQRYQLEHENRNLDSQLRKISAKANLDALTGLYNRARLDDLLRQMTVGTGALAGNEKLVMCIMDIDHFKSINDRFGHAVGDDALRAVSAVIRAELDPNDTAIRYGGEEFLLIFRNAGIEDGAFAANRIRRSIARQNILGAAGVYFMTASFGLAQWQQGEAFHDVFRRADRALYRAKEEGRDRVEIAVPIAVLSSTKSENPSLKRPVPELT